MAIVGVRRQFLARMQAVLQERGAVQAALQRPVPPQFGDGMALNEFAEGSIALAERLRALAEEEAQAFNLMSYGVREARARLLLCPHDSRLHVAFLQPCMLHTHLSLRCAVSWGRGRC